ncbi:glycosyltransferase [Marinicrinis sediminis]|uniref:Glycosyltransferase n=1 Tax=Marinicrinis sediminis TaxID=1652465 RepID=A0ABW5RD10_9BACL
MTVTQKHRPLISVIICTYNRASLLSETLMALPELHRMDQAEVIVVDNQSTDHTAAVVAQFQQHWPASCTLRYVREREQGLSHARNRGIEEASGDWIAFLDDDAIPERNWLQMMVQAFERYPDAEGIGGKIRPRFETARPDWLIHELELPYTIVDLGDEEKKYPKHLFPFGANMVLKREVVERIRFPVHLGRKGNSLLSGEESWLFQRIQDEGGALYYIPGLVVDHFIPEERLTKEWIRKRYYYQGVSHGLASAKRMQKLRLLLVLGLKLGYVAADSLRAREDGRRLLNRCRLDSIQGTWRTLTMKGDPG